MYQDNVRINRFDNLKGLAIFLVVLGHFIYFSKSSGIALIHNSVLVLHLPIFFFVAGYFSKIGPDEPIKAFKRLMIPFIVFCILYWIYAKFILLTNPNTLFIHPGYGLWFLISLFIMKMMLPILDKLKYPILISFVAAIFSGFIDCSVLGLSRTFNFLPVFLIGFYYRDIEASFSRHYPPIYNFLNRKSSLIIILVLTVICVICAAYVLPDKLFYLKEAYGSSKLVGIIGKIIIISLGILWTLLLNKLMTNRMTFLTKFGKNSMSVYILHLFTVAFFHNLFKQLYPNYGMLTLILVVVMTVAVVFVTSRDIVAQGLNRFTDSVFNLFF